MRKSPPSGGDTSKGVKMNPKQIKALRDKTGCSLRMCRDAWLYAEERQGDEDMALAYCKAKTLAVQTHCPFDERVQRFMEVQHEQRN
jgi:hypothetical protein